MGSFAIFSSIYFFDAFSEFCHRLVYAIWKRDLFLSIQVLFLHLFWKRVNSFFERAFDIGKMQAFPQLYQYMPVNCNDFYKEIIFEGSTWIKDETPHQLHHCSISLTDNLACVTCQSDGILPWHINFLLIASFIISNLLDINVDLFFQKPRFFMKTNHLRLSKIVWCPPVGSSINNSLGIFIP